MAPNKPDNDKTFPIHIDRQMFKVSSHSMTGLELRALPSPPIGPDRELYEVAPGHDDVVVTDDRSVELRPGQHFVTAPRNVTPG